MYILPCFNRILHVFLKSQYLFLQFLCGTLTPGIGSVANTWVRNLSTGAFSNSVMSYRVEPNVGFPIR